MRIVRTIVVPMGLLLAMFSSCSKKATSGGGGGNNPNPPPTDSNYNPVDPPPAASIGFFLNGWQPKTFTAPATVAGPVFSGSLSDTLTINVNNVITKVSPYVFGNNSNLWSGQFVTEPVLMQYMKDLSPNIIRGPGGSISDVYFWNDTSAGPADAPAQLLDANGTPSSSPPYWFGGNTASWTFTLSNYYNLLAQTNSTGIITINYGYARYGTGPNPVAAAAHLAADWVRHDNGRTKYWEIGNENYGNWEAGYLIDQTKNKDGQPSTITGNVYGNHVKVFADSMRAAATQIGATIYIGATLEDSPPYNGAYQSLVTWNQGVLSTAGSTVDFFIVHDYFTAYNANSTPADILSTANTIPAAGMSYVKQQIATAGLSMKPVALTEWNIQAVGSKQDVSYVAGMHAAKTIGSIIRNQFGEASRWDMANGWSGGDDMGLFNHGDEPGAPLWNPRPAFYYLYYFQKLFGDRMVKDTLAAINGDLTTYSGTFTSGQAGTVVINSGTSVHNLGINFQHFPAGSKYYWYVLTGGTDNGSFSGQVYVNGTGPSTATGGPLNYASLKAYSAPLTGMIRLTVPPMSVIYLVADKK
ncbi:MAG: alpha-L-arabinofuranosidase [Bacteroidota bacterium]|nr:alpha-L-arabinofuranosidase [Bacteroidota bacterium]MDP4253783.1 alpha-L-arabinofuranosidase [Bacteroidota bacterium]